MRKIVKWALSSAVVGATIFGGARPSESATGSSFDTNASQRKACTYGPGSTISQSVGANVPRGDTIPIKHVVVLMMENRSFDHYYSGLKKYYPNPVGSGGCAASDSKCVDVWPDGKNVGSSYTSQKVKVPQHHEKHYCVTDTAHNWEPVHRQWNGGKMDQFAAESDPGGVRTMGYYTEADLPFYYYLASNYAISDRYFSPLLGPTWPNRWFFYGATSWGRLKTPDKPVLPNELQARPDIVAAMKTAGKSVKLYRGGSVQWAMAGFADPSRAGESLENFEEDVRKNRLPDLSILDPNFIILNFDKATTRDDDEHPPSNIQRGQRFAARVIAAITSNAESWKNTALFITYDEHGGLYDHVAPPPACDPGDSFSQGLKDTEGKAAKLDHYGVRVPLIIVSPYAKRGYVSHEVADHTSITRFIEAKFGLGALTKRDANAWPLYDMFDFTVVPKEDTALKTAVGLAQLNPTEDAWCRNNEPESGFSDGTSGSCTAATPQADVEPNGSVDRAQSVKDPSCHNLTSSVAAKLPVFATPLPVISGTLSGAGDVDFFYHESVDAYSCNIAPKAEILTDGVEVCVFPICKTGGKVSLKCTGGSSLEELGVVEQGCCRTGKGKIEMDYDCKGTTDESGRVYYRVTQKKTACTGYKFTYQY